MTAGVFYETEEARPDFLLERIKHCKVDTVLWYQPDHCARETARLLQDNGIRVIGVADGGLPPLSCRFEISREKAAEKILHNWKMSDAIRKVSVVHAVRRSAIEEERLEGLLQSAGWDYEFEEAGRADYETLLRGLAAEQERGIILLGAAASLFAFRVPDLLTALMSRRRVALVDGPVSLPFGNASFVRVDLAAADWEAVANGIADELLTGEAFARSRPTVFQATAYLQAPLSEFSQAI
ncbi:MAG TPA: hypothetical protein VH188_05620 [Chthoniobacterales bacterium]|nr:hypothetical protein [Chthoniobacterales bacterium]